MIGRPSNPAQRRVAQQQDLYQQRQQQMKELFGTDQYDRPRLPNIPGVPGFMENINLGAQDPQAFNRKLLEAAARNASPFRGGGANNLGGGGRGGSTYDNEFGKIIGLNKNPAGGQGAPQVSRRFTNPFI